MPSMNIVEAALDSDDLMTLRNLSVFLPPKYQKRQCYPVVFCADGQSIPAFADRLTHGMTSETIPPTILIGVHSDPATRAEEYLHGVDDDRFRLHEVFFTQAAERWARKHFSISPDRKARAVFGFSNGAAFALSVGVRSREKYGVVIAFSIAGGANRVPKSAYGRNPTPRYYLAAGSHELPFRKTVRTIASTSAKRKVDHTVTEPVGGHDLDF